MTLSEFRSSLNNSSPPPVSGLLRAMWYDRKGDWNKAHDIAQEIHTREGAWIHAYLHRAEGDLFNARYWYQRAGTKMPSCSLSEEWEELVTEFLNLS